MRALVTGGAGFIGSAIARALIARGDEVVVFDDLSAGSREAVPNDAILVEGDIRETETLETTFRGIDIVFHHAAVKSVPRSLDEPALVNDVNASGTLSVLQASERAGVQRVVYASSSSIYGGSDGTPSHEDDLPKPLSPYGVSKLAGEYYCRVWSALGRLSTVTLRYFNVFGPGQPADSTYAAVFPSFIAAFLQSERPVIYGDGEQTRDFTYIDDVVRANLLAAEAPGADAAVVNVAGGDPRSVNDVLRSVAYALGLPARSDNAPPRPGDIRHSYADAGRAARLLGWKPETEWRSAVKNTVSWFTS